MSKHSTYLAVGLTTAVLTCQLRGKAPSGSPLRYDEFLDRVRERHPERSLDEKRLAKTKASEARTGLLPDPQLSVGRDNVALPGGLGRGAGMAEARREGKWTIGLAQSFPWPGTLAAQEKAAASFVTASQTASSLASAERHFAAAELFLRLVKLQKLVEVERANVQVVDDIRQFTHEKFKQGIGSHLEFLQSHSEAGVLKAKLAALETDLLNLKRHALVLMGEESFSDPDSVGLALDWPSGLVADEAERGAASGARSDLVREQIIRQKDVALAGQDAEYRRSLPSLTTSGWLMQEDGGMPMLGAMIGFSLPVYSYRERRALREARALTESTLGDDLAWHNRRKDLALIQAQSRVAQIQATARTLQREIIPPAKEHMEAATVQFAQGKSALTAIIDGRRTLLALQVSEINTVEALALARLSVEKIQTGLLDVTLDTSAPQLTSTLGLGMTSQSASAMGGMPELKREMPSKRRSTGGQDRSRSSPLDGWPTQDEPSKGAGSGMGM